MDRRELIGNIVRYSALYLGDSNANEERNTHKFHLLFKAEEEIRDKLPSARLIILTGEAGDGKSRMLSTLREEATANGFGRIVEDFSQETKEQKEWLVERMGDILEGKSDEKMMLGANIGLLVQYVLRSRRLSFDLLRASDKVGLFNFERRNLAEDAAFFSGIVREFLTGTSPSCEDGGCKHHGACPFDKNLRALLTPPVQENIRLLCNAIYLMGAHITLRELLSLLASLATGGFDCHDLQQGRAAPRDIPYYNIFDKSDGVLLEKLRPLDPAGTALPGDDELFESCMFDLTAFLSSKRESFFRREGNALKDLPVSYLQDFSDLLRLLCDEAPAYDSTEPHPSIIKIKQGLVRLITPEQSDLEISFFDIPTPTHERIMTRFSIDLSDVPLIWHHPEWRPPASLGENPASRSKSVNTLCLSGFYMENDVRKMYTLQIGYELFREILLAGDGFFSPSSANSLHKYGLSDFFRQILLACPQYGKRVEILFDDDKYCDFEMSYHTPNSSILGTPAKTRVLLKRK